MKGLSKYSRNYCLNLAHYNVHCSSVALEKMGRNIKADSTLIGVIVKGKEKKNAIRHVHNEQYQVHNERYSEIALSSPFNPLNSRYRYAYSAHCLVHNSFEHFGVVLIDGNSYMVKQGETYAQHYIQSINSSEVVLKDERNVSWCISLKKSLQLSVS